MSDAVWPATLHLETAVRSFDTNGVQHDEIKDLSPSLDLYVLAVHDPDNIQFELTSPTRNTAAASAIYTTSHREDDSHA